MNYVRSLFILENLVAQTILAILKVSGSLRLVLKLRTPNPLQKRSSVIPIWRNPMAQRLLMSKALFTTKEARLLDDRCPVKQDIEEVLSRKRHRCCSFPLGLVWGCCPAQSWEGGGEDLSCERGSGEGPCCGGVLGHDGYAMMYDMMAVGLLLTGCWLSVLQRALIVSEASNPLIRGVYRE